MKFIVFGEDWGRHPSSTQHLFKHIAKEHEVIWVNSIGMRTPTLAIKDIKRAFEKLRSKFSFFKPLQGAQQSVDSTAIKIVEPKVLPWHQVSWVQGLNKWLFARQLNQIMCSHENAVFWVSVPTAEYLLPESSEKTVYYIGDDFSGLAGVDYKLVKPFEDKLLKRADVVLACSEALMEKFKSINPKLLSHGVDLELFSRGCYENFIANSVPTVGFYGSINDWLDLDLLRNIALSRPNIRLELIGKIETDLGDLLTLPNVAHKPAVPHYELPKHVQSWNVALLPFKDCAQIRACNPLKLREYLASGTPVVSTRYKAVEQYAEQVFIADDHLSFLNHIDNASHIKEVARGWVDWQQQSVKQDSWQKKASDLLNNI